MDTSVISALITLLIVIIIAVLFFIWQRSIAYDILEEKGYVDKKIGCLLFFMPLICWIYVCALPNKSQNQIQ